MKYGVIDIGSNTIKAFVYDSERNYEVISSMHRPTKLINYIDNKIMSKDGIRSAINDISTLKEFLISENCGEIYSYATSATRDCRNCDEIIAEINTSCGLDTDVLSGKAEALCDAKGATLLGKKDFLCIDLGGGSGQVCEYHNGELIYAKSWPIGALRTKRELDGSNFPDTDEKEKTISYVMGYISEEKITGENLPVIIMGGASQSSKKIMEHFDIGKKCSKRVFMEVYEKLLSMQYDERMALLTDKAPLRAEILGYALIILDTLIGHFCTSEIIFTEKGSREGYLLYKLEGTDFTKIV